MLSTYAGYQFYARNPTTAAQRVAAEAPVSRETAYYRANIGKVKSVDDLLANPRLYTYALKSHGLEDAIPNRGFVRKVLTSDLTQPRSFANALNDTRYRALAAAFGFSTSGKLPTTAVAQGAAQENETLGLYAGRTLVGTTQQADITYYQAHIGNVHSVTDLAADSRLYRIALQAYGLDPRRDLDRDGGAPPRGRPLQPERRGRPERPGVGRGAVAGLRRGDGRPLHGGGRPRCGGPGRG